ncbi:MAG: hypothetical protein K5770_07520 [Lachnospiraceae bacterium]|nr:hypothetical protein [Lachnospiraceae bacterium]
MENMAWKKTEDQKTGRGFALIGLDKDGNSFVLTDTDTDPATITVAVNFEGYAFDLIYRD